MSPEFVDMDGKNMRLEPCCLKSSCIYCGRKFSSPADANWHTPRCPHRLEKIYAAINAMWCKGYHA